MADMIHGVFGGVPPIQGPGKPQTGREKIQDQAFDQIFKEQLNKEPLKFSAHAQERIRVRQIPLSGHDVERLQNAVLEVEKKGGRESLVLMDNSAFVVSVKNRTVITALDQEGLKNNVFTNIDSAVVV